MKVLHLAGELEDVGGVLSVIRNLQTASEKWGWQHTVCVHRNYQEVRRPALTYFRSSHLYSDSPNHWHLLFCAFRTFFELNRFLKSTHFDILHAHSRGTFLIGLAFAIWFKRPVVYTNHGYSQRLRMYRRAARFRDFHTVLLTPNMVRYYGLSEAPPRVSVISECCADAFFVEPLVAAASERPQDRPLRLVGVGNITRWKNWHLVLEAFQHLSHDDRQNVTFDLWGPVPIDTASQDYAKELRERVSELGLGGQFRFRGPTVAVTQCLRQADWFVLPSTNEPCSVALIEALALGMPALVSASGGNVDIIQVGKNGWLFAPDDVRDLAALLRKMIRREAGINSPEQIRESVRSRSATEVTSSYRALYEQILKTPKLAARAV
jgi:glycosyltransferase involved in cell wall biosynthesis